MFFKLSILPLISGSYVVHFSSEGALSSAPESVPLAVLGRHFSCALPARQQGDDAAWTALLRAAWLRGRCLEGHLEGQAFQLCLGRSFTRKGEQATAEALEPLGWGFQEQYRAPEWSARVVCNCYAIKEVEQVPCGLGREVWIDGMKETAGASEA